MTVNRRWTVSGRSWLFLGSSAAVFAAAAWFAHARPAARSAPTQEEATLAAERDRLKPSDERTLASLREEARALARYHWTQDRLDTLKRRLEPDWHWEWLPVDHTPRVVLTARSSRLEDWPQHHALVSELAATPGVVVEEIEFHAEGPARARRFDRVMLRVRFLRDDPARSDAERAAPSRVPLPAAPAESPANSRKVGPPLRSAVPLPSPSLRQPGRPPLRFGPDPSGSWAGIENQTINHMTS